MIGTRIEIARGAEAVLTNGAELAIAPVGYESTFHAVTAYSREVGVRTRCARATQTAAIRGRSVATWRPRACAPLPPPEEGLTGLRRGERDPDPAPRHAERACELEQLAAGGSRARCGATWRKRFL